MLINAVGFMEYQCSVCDRFDETAAADSRFSSGLRYARVGDGAQMFGHRVLTFLSILQHRYHSNMLQYMLTELQDLVITTTEASNAAAQCPLSRNKMLCILTCKSHACFHRSDIAATTAMVLEPVYDSPNAIVDAIGRSQMFAFALTQNTTDHLSRPRLQTQQPPSTRQSTTCRAWCRTWCRHLFFTRRSFNALFPSSAGFLRDYLASGYCTRALNVSTRSARFLPSVYSCTPRKRLVPIFPYCLRRSMFLFCRLFTRPSGVEILHPRFKT